MRKVMFAIAVCGGLSFFSDPLWYKLEAATPANPTPAIAQPQDAKRFYTQYELTRAQILRKDVDTATIEAPGDGAGSGGTGVGNGDAS